MPSVLCLCRRRKGRLPTLSPGLAFACNFINAATGSGTRPRISGSFDSSRRGYGAGGTAGRTAAAAAVPCHAARYTEGPKGGFFSEGTQEKPDGILFGETPPPPGESRKWESWEAPWCATPCSAACDVGL